MTDAWLGRLLGLARQLEVDDWALRHDVEEIKSQLVFARSALERAERKVEAQEKRVRAREQRIAEALQGLVEMRDDPLVLVRNYGVENRRYHSADSPCGWVGNRSGYNTLLWGEAQAKGYGPCSSCGYRVKYVAERARQAHQPDEQTA